MGVTTAPNSASTQHRPLRLIAKVLGLEPSDPAVVAAFDQLVPFAPGWWELIRWSKAEKIARGLSPLRAFCVPRWGSIPEKSIGATGFEPAT